MVLPKYLTRTSDSESSASHLHVKILVQKPDEREDQGADGCKPPGAAERDVKVAHDVVRAVPCEPKAQRQLLVSYAAGLVNL
jgi:hypothetical protein